MWLLHCLRQWHRPSGSWQPLDQTEWGLLCPLACVWKWRCCRSSKHLCHPLHPLSGLSWPGGYTTPALSSCAWPFREAGVPGPPVSDYQCEHPSLPITGAARGPAASGAPRAPGSPPPGSQVEGRGFLLCALRPGSPQSWGRTPHQRAGLSPGHWSDGRDRKQRHLKRITYPQDSGSVKGPGVSSTKTEH